MSPERPLEIGKKAAWSPNDKLLLTGTSREHKNDGPGRLVFMHRETLETVKEIEIGERSVVSIMWHHRHVSTFITVLVSYDHII